MLIDALRGGGGEVSGRCVLDCASLGITRVVDQDVDLAELLDGLGDHASGLDFDADAAGIASGFETLLAQVLGEALCHRGAFLVEAISLTLTLAPRQFQSVLPPEAGTGARYQRNHKSNLQLAMADLLPCYRAAETDAT